MTNNFPRIFKNKIALCTSLMLALGLSRRDPEYLTTSVSPHSFSITKTKKGLLVDESEELLYPLTNTFLLGPYNLTNAAIPPHKMDVVILAAAADTAVAMCVHNLYHLLGFRRFFFLVNDIRDCPIMLDLLPQHNGQSQCLEHAVFYSQQEFELIKSTSIFPKIHRGDPHLYLRGQKEIQISKMGWYLQQFSKLLVHRKVPDLSKQYFVIDGDVIFTRPFQLISESGKIILHKSIGTSTHWKQVADHLLGESASVDSFMLGWMVLDQSIVEELIHVIEKKLAGPKFPLNVLYLAEESIDDENHFSEFYIYSRFALEHHSDIVEENMNRAPYLLWEEHKYHAYDACPNQEGKQEVDLWNIAFWHDFHPPPWGGGNQFLLALRYGLENLFGLTVVAKNDKDGENTIQHLSQVILANSITFGGKTKILEKKKQKSELAFVHRVDGPYYVARYSRPLKSQTFDIPKEDKQTQDINQRYACATVFQSEWSWQSNEQIGLALRNPVLIPNTVNPTVFYPPPNSRDLKARKIRIVASSHSNNLRKGFDTIMFLDAHLDINRFELIYMGQIPTDGSFKPKHLQLWEAKGSEQVSDFLRTGDIYFAPSRAEPASNAVLEALACGLPVLYQSGSSHGELVGDGGLGFSDCHEIIAKLEDLVANYEQYVSGIHIPTIRDVARQYLSIMRWCFFMRHTII